MNIPDQPFFEMDRSAHNTRSRSHNISGRMLTISPDELEISPSTVPAVENTTKKPAEPNDKPITGRTKAQHTFKIFQHPLFNKENHPTKGANILEDLQDDINNNEYSPWWFEFLSRAIDYDCHLFDQSYKIKQSLKRVRNKRNQTIQERDIAIQEQSDVQELLRSAQIEVGRLKKETKVLTKRLETQPELSIHDQDRPPSMQHSSLIPQTYDVDGWGYSLFGMRSQQKDQRNHLYSRNWHPHSRSYLQSRTRILYQQDYLCSCSRSHICVHLQHQSHSCSRVNQWNRSRACDDSQMQMTYQARDANPSKKLTGKNIQDYNSWAHLIR